MKKLITITSVVLISTVMFAGGIEKGPKSAAGIAVTKNAEDGVVKVYYKSEETSDVKISILDGRRNKVFSETIKNADGFIRPYQFSHLPEGEYTIEVDNGSAIKVERIAHGAPAIEKLSKLTKFRNENKYMLAFSGKGSEKITVNIYDGRNRLLHSETNTVVGNHAKLYNLSSVKDNVTFEVVHQSGATERVEF